MRRVSWFGVLGIVLLGTTVLLPDASRASSEVDGYAIEDLQLQFAADLVDVCTIDTGHDHYEAALAFCYGFFEGAIQYDDVISKTPSHVDIVCSPPDTTRSQAAEVFVEYMQANPQYGGDLPLDGIFRALVDKWPCE